MASAQSHCLDTSSHQPQALLRFLSLLAAMFIATLMMGSLPLLSSLSPWRMSAFASFGSGLLLGAAMAVVLPEGAWLEDIRAGR